MKRNSISVLLGLAMLLALSLIHRAVGQNKGLNIEIDLSTKPAWYEQPWVMVALFTAVLIVILFAILKRKRKQ
jgi:cytochrome bd-type quinol oxidase subunit 2